MDSEIRTNEQGFSRFFTIISRNLNLDEWQLFGVALGLNYNDILELANEGEINQYRLEYTILRMLENLKQKENFNFNDIRIKLKEFERMDILQMIEEELEAMLRKDSNASPEKYKDSYSSSENELSNLQKQIQTKQQKHFLHLQLSRSLWLRKKMLPLEELFVSLLIKEKNAKGEEERTIRYCDIFDIIDDKVPTRILIEGNAGYGKTTLIAKFLSDWSREKEYIRKKFDLVFIIPLRNFVGKIETHLLQQSEGIEGSEEDKLEAIKAIENRVLLFLDGLDEISGKVKESLLALLRGDEYCDMTVVVTCRSGLFQLENISEKSLNHTNVKGFEGHLVWDRRVQIKGIPDAGRSKFLQTYLNIDDEQLNESLLKCKFELNDLYECPLFLLLLAVIIQETNFEFIKTKTELFKKFSNFVISRSLYQEGELEDLKNLDFYDLKNKEKFDCRNLLIDYGRLCLEKLKNHSLIFEENELLKCSNGDKIILKLGFVSKQISFFNYEEKVHYEPIHRSLLEFSAAFYLSYLDEKEMNEEIAGLLLRSDIWPRRNQLIYSFLAGFLQSNAFLLFNAFYQYRQLISIFSDEDYPYSLKDILLEIPEDDAILNSLSNLPPGHWESIKYEDSLLRWFVGLLKTFQKQGRKITEISLKIPDNLPIINNLSENVYVHLISIQIPEMQVNDEKLNLNGIYIQGQNLIISSINTIDGYSLRDIKSKFRFEKIWLEVDFSYCLRYKEILSEPDIGIFGFFSLYKELLKDHAQNFKLHYLILNGISFSLLQAISPFIEDLIKEKKIDYGINIKLVNEERHDLNEKLLKSFVSFILKSHLRSFEFELDEYKPDCYGLSNPDFHSKTNFINVSKSLTINIPNDEKQWEFLGLKGFLTIKNVNELEHFSAVHLDCNIQCADGISSFKNLLLKTKNIRKLTCNDDLIYEIGSSNSLSGWRGIETIQKLDLLSTTGRFNSSEKGGINSFVKGVSLFWNLQHLNLVSYDWSEFPFEVFSLLPSLKIISINDPFIQEKFFKGLLNLRDKSGKKGLTLDEVEVTCIIFEICESNDFIQLFEDETCDEILDEISEMKDFLQLLEECFKKFIFLKLSILCSSNDFPIIKFLKYFFSKPQYFTSSELKEISHYGPVLFGPVQNNFMNKISINYIKNADK